MPFSLLIYLIIFSSSLLSFITADDDFAVSGQVFCTTTGQGIDVPIKDTMITFWEEDNGRDATIDHDDLMGQTNSNENGEFNVKGSTGEWGEEELYLWIEHKCNKDFAKPPAEGCFYGTFVDLRLVLNDDGPYEVQNLKIYLGQDHGESGDENLYVTTNWEPYCKPVPPTK